MIFDENHDNKKLQCLYNFLNIVLSAQSLVSNEYTIFHKKEFISEVLEKLKSHNNNEKENSHSDNSKITIWKPYLMLSFIKKICICKNQQNIKISYTKKIIEYKEIINQIILKKFYQDEKILKLLIQLCWIDDVGLDDPNLNCVVKPNTILVLEINELVQEIIPEGYKNEFMEQISFDKNLLK